MVINMINLVKTFVGRVYCLLYGIKYHNNIQVTPPCKFRIQKKAMSIGRNVSISSSSIFLGVTKRAKIMIGSNVRIAHHFQISCANEVRINDNVNIAPFVFITDHNHKFEDPTIPIKDQGISMEENSSVIVDDGSWIGTKVTIIGKVHIGKHCVIGANSVVTKSIPDYCIAVGAPARIVKRYNPENKKWEKP